MKITRLHDLDTARALADCYYATFGLTYHRALVYEPERLLDLNRSGDLTSFVAIDNGRVVGHLAAFRPFFDVEAAGPGDRLAGTRTREIGLSVVHPSVEAHAVHGRLHLALHQWAREEGVAGLLARYPTFRIGEQQAAFAAGGTPVALFLGGVPRWMNHDPALSHLAGRPLSTIAFYLPIRIVESRPVALPPDLDFLWDFIRQARVPRHLPEAGAGPATLTRLSTSWDIDRRNGSVHVATAGDDLVERVVDGVEWLVDGGMEHVTAYLPAEDPRTAEAHEALAAKGLFFAGWLPCWRPDGGDALLYQALTRTDLRPEDVQVYGAAADILRSRVLERWRPWAIARPSAA